MPNLERLESVNQHIKKGPVSDKGAAQSALARQMHDKWRAEELPASLAERQAQTAIADDTWFRPIKAYRWVTDSDDPARTKERTRTLAEAKMKELEAYPGLRLVEDQTDDGETAFQIEQDLNRHSSQIEPMMNMAKNGNLAGGYISVALPFVEKGEELTVEDVKEGGRQIHDVWIANNVWELEPLIEDSPTLAKHFEDVGIEGIYEDNVTADLITRAVDGALEDESGLARILREIGQPVEEGSNSPDTADSQGRELELNRSAARLKQFRSYELLPRLEQIKDERYFLQAVSVLLGIDA